MLLRYDYIFLRSHVVVTLGRLGYCVIGEETTINKISIYYDGYGGNDTSLFLSQKSILP